MSGHSRSNACANSVVGGIRIKMCVNLCACACSCVVAQAVVCHLAELSFSALLKNWVTRCEAIIWKRKMLIEI